MVKMWTRGAVALTVAALALLALGAGTAPAQAAGGNRTWHVQVGAQSHDKAVQGLVFLPREIWINVGDTVHWMSASDDIHTVTFLKAGQQQPTFNEGDPQQTQAQGGGTYAGQTYHNSGLLSDMTGMTHTYMLRFIVVGTFTYLCLVHPGQVGIIHVRPAGTRYPYSQGHYDAMASAGTNQLVQQGERLERTLFARGTNHHVYVGGGNGTFSLMRFLRPTVHIRVGESVTFTNTDPIEPHTVTFGKEQSQDFAPYGTPKAWDGTSPLGSGFLGAHYPGGTTFTVTFLKAGTYPYICSLHDMMGMVGTVVVSDGTWPYYDIGWDDGTSLWQ